MVLASRRSIQFNEPQKYYYKCMIHKILTKIEIEWRKSSLQYVRKYEVKKDHDLNIK